MSNRNKEISEYLESSKTVSLATVDSNNNPNLRTLGGLAIDGLKEIYLLVQLANEGVNIDPNLFKDLDYEETYKEQVHRLFDLNFNTYIASKIPAGFRLKSSGKYSPIYWNPKSKLSIILNDGKYNLTKNQHVIQEVVFEHKPKTYNKKTSDGKDISRIINL